MASEEDPSLDYFFFRAVNFFYGLSLPDPLVFLSMWYLEIIFSFGGLYQLHHSS